MALGAALLAGRPASAQGFGGTVEDILVRGDAYLQAQRSNEAIRAVPGGAHPLPHARRNGHRPAGGGARPDARTRSSLPAAGILEEAIQRFPNDPRQPDLLYLAGMARNQGGDMQGAATLLRKALDANPTPDLLPALRFWLARSLRLDGKPKDVVELLKTFEKDFPEEPADGARPLLPRAGAARHGRSRRVGGDLPAPEWKAYPHTQETSEALSSWGRSWRRAGARRGGAVACAPTPTANPLGGGGALDGAGGRPDAVPLRRMRRPSTTAWRR
jgi:tetratricopeptide (TPR) repeat protein